MGQRLSRSGAVDVRPGDRSADGWAAARDRPRNCDHHLDGSGHLLRDVEVAKRQRRCASGWWSWTWWDVAVDREVFRHVGYVPRRIEDLPPQRVVEASVERKGAVETVVGAVLGRRGAVEAVLDVLDAAQCVGRRNPYLGRLVDQRIGRDRLSLYRPDRTERSGDIAGGTGVQQREIDRWRRFVDGELVQLRVRRLGGRRGLYADLIDALIRD